MSRRWGPRSGVYKAPEASQCRWQRCKDQQQRHQQPSCLKTRPRQAAQSHTIDRGAATTNPAQLQELLSAAGLSISRRACVDLLMNWAKGKAGSWCAPGGGGGGGGPVVPPAAGNMAGQQPVRAGAHGSDELQCIDSVHCTQDSHCTQTGAGADRQRTLHTGQSLYPDRGRS